MSISKRYLELLLLIVSAFLLLSSCSNNTTTSGPETGSIAFSLEWPSDVPRRAQALNDPDIDCDAANIATVSVIVYNSNKMELKRESFLCSVGEGTVSDIESGSNMEIYIYAIDDTGTTNLYEAIVTGITISPNEITDVGTIELGEVDPNADSDGDGVTDDLDQCPNTPSEVENDEIDSDGCPLDSDDDGVPDYLDDCPNTPRGLEVDEDGCTETFTNSLGMTFNHISAGTFTMGSPDEEPRESEINDADETQHQVTLTQSFYMQITEVTQTQWLAVMESNPSNNSDCASCPVERVSWNNIQDFITELNKLGEGTYSLPTEAQWEYAARAGTDTAFSSGEITEYGDMLACNYDANLNSIGWYCYNSGSTKEVGGKNPNTWGLYDMGGNVWEWCEDWYGAYSLTSVTDPTGPAIGTTRVMRGGGYNGFASSARSADRYWREPERSAHSIGFRLVVQP